MFYFILFIFQILLGFTPQSSLTPRHVLPAVHDAIQMRKGSSAATRKDHVLAALT